MKALCICLGGDVRSGTLAYWLKRAGHDALACGTMFNSAETLAMLAAWADRIFVLESSFALDIPESHRDKVTVVDVGPDVWHSAPLDGDLIAKLRSLVPEIA